VLCNTSLLMHAGLRAPYPPRVDSELDAAATGIAALMTDLAAAAAPATTASSQAVEVHLGSVLGCRMPHFTNRPWVSLMCTSMQAKPVQQSAALPAQAASAAALMAAPAAAAPDSEDDSANEDDEPLSIDSGAEESDDEQQGTAAIAAVHSAEPAVQPVGQASALAQPAADAEPATGAQLQDDAMEVPCTPAGGALHVPHDDEAAVCATLFQGLVIYLG
jgi:hypothetical protein